MSTHQFDTKIDFVISGSVLEHVPTTDILKLLQNLANNLSDDGIMIHCIHLEDHQDFQNSPFNFLSEPQQKFTRQVQEIRGNRLRKSQWMDLLSHVENMEFKLIYEWKRTDKKLPSIIDSSINYKDYEDLITTHIGIMGKKIE